MKTFDQYKQDLRFYKDCINLYAPAQTQRKKTVSAVKRYISLSGADYLIVNLADMQKQSIIFKEVLQKCNEQISLTKKQMALTWKTRHDV